MVIPLAHSSQNGTPTSRPRPTENKQTAIPCKWYILFWTWRRYFKTHTEWVCARWMEAVSFESFAAFLYFWCCFVVLIWKFVRWCCLGCILGAFTFSKSFVYTFVLCGRNWDAGDIRGLKMFFSDTSYFREMADSKNL